MTSTYTTHTEQYRKKQEEQDEKNRMFFAMLIAFGIMGVFLILLFFIKLTPADNSELEPRGEMIYKLVNFGQQLDKGKGTNDNAIQPTEPQQTESQTENTPQETKQQTEATPKLATDESSTQAEVKTSIEPDKDQNNEPKKEEEKQVKPQQEKTTDNNTTKTENQNPTEKTTKPEEGEGNTSQVGNRGDLVGEPNTGPYEHNLSAWKLAELPKVDDKTAETGIIVINFAINASGRVTYAKIRQNTGMSSIVAEKYRKAFQEKVLFKPINSSVNVPNETKGQFTIRIEKK
ncbi:MAG: hypothetical protein JJT94_07200 [Bernardetiaceae bacterium]|nr:hypothetical protein [Bernardetiaceae bacterium]